MRRPMRTLARALAPIAVALPAFTVGAAQPGGFLAPSGGGRVQPGTDLVASWTLDRIADPDIDEAELVLSLDGGMTFPVRLTGRIPPEDRSVQWRVPSLPTENARIGLRTGHREQWETEDVLFVSEVFAIASARSFPKEELFCINGEWRTREAMAGAPARPLAQDVAPSDGDPTLDPIDADDAGMDTGPAAIDIPAAPSVRSSSRPPSVIRSAFCPSGSLTAAAPLRL